MYSAPCAEIAATDHQRTNAVRIAEAEQAMADDHRHDGEAAADAAIDGGQAAKMSAADARGVPARDSSLASTLSSTSESELVLR